MNWFQIFTEAAPVVLQGAKYFFSLAPVDRRDALKGTWGGKGSEKDVESDQKLPGFTARMIFRVQRSRVTGEATLAGRQAVDEELTLVGGFNDNDYLQISYKSK